MTMSIDASDETDPGKWQCLAEPTISVPVPTPHHNPAREKLLAVYEIIEAKLSKSGSRMIAFIGTTPTDGASTLARTFADLLCTELDKRVLLLRARDSSPRMDLQARKACEDVVYGRLNLPDVLQQVSDSQLFLGHVSANARWISTLVTKPAFLDVAQQLRTSFDYIIVDASTSSSPTEAVSLCARSDATVLVIESEKTRWQVAKYLCDDITSRGGSVLGVLINRMPRHIPDLIYRWL